MNESVSSSLFQSSILQKSKKKEVLDMQSAIFGILVFSVYGLYLFFMLLRMK